jgi:hypothetical protein
LWFCAAPLRSWICGFFPQAATLARSGGSGDRRKFMSRLFQMAALYRDAATSVVCRRRCDF